MSGRRPASLAELARQTGIPLDRSDEKTLALIDQHGWMVMHVFDPSGDAPGCSFSIGLTYRFQQPELLMIGLPPDVMRGVINEVGRLMAGGERFTDGDTRRDLLEEDYVCRFVSVHPVWYPEYLGAALWFNRWFNTGATLSVLQCVWPDMRGRSPWDPEADAAFRRLQPVLNEPPQGYRVS